jgi:protein required for attachment to host cells
MSSGLVAPKLILLKAATREISVRSSMDSGESSMNTNKTWILVADAGRARVLEKTGSAKSLILVQESVLTHDNPKTSDIVRDRQPRSYDSVGRGRHAMSHGTDPHRAAKASFAAKLVDHLERSYAKGEFEWLVMIAPPQMLGDLRQALPESLRQIVSDEIALDLTRASDADVARHLDHT